MEPEADRLAARHLRDAQIDREVRERLGLGIELVRLSQRGESKASESARNISAILRSIPEDELARVGRGDRWLREAIGLALWGVPDDWTEQWRASGEALKRLRPDQVATSSYYKFDSINSALRWVKAFSQGRVQADGWVVVGSNRAADRPSPVSRLEPREIVLALGLGVPLTGADGAPAQVRAEVARGLEQEWELTSMTAAVEAAERQSPSEQRLLLIDEIIQSIETSCDLTALSSTVLVSLKSLLDEGKEDVVEAILSQDLSHVIAFVNVVGRNTG